VTALALSPDAKTGCQPAAAAGVDRAIRVSTAVAVLAVAGIAAYVSYWHAYAVVCAHGETGVTARLEPATIDGLVYASSMVNLHAARHRLPVSALARWLLALGIVATLAANMAQGWSHGPVGAIIAAWPAVSLVGSYELLGLDHPDRSGRRAGLRASGGPALPAAGPRRRRPLARAWLGARCRTSEPVWAGHRTRTRHRGQPAVPAPAEFTDPRTGPGLNAPDHPDRAADQANQVSGRPSAAGTSICETDTNAAAVAAYRASVQAGQAMSERKLAEKFGKTSRRWARSRMAEARRSLATA